MNYQDDMGRNLPHAGSPRPAPPGFLSSPHWLVIGLLVAAVGVVMLFLPVSATVNGTKVGCGSTFMADEEPAEQYNIDNSGQAYADLLGYEYRGKPVGNDSPNTKCADRLVLQAGIAWPMVIIGAGLAVRGLVNRRDNADPSDLPKAGRPTAAGPPPPDGGSQTQTSDAPLPHRAQLPPPSGPAVQIPQPTPPGWYQCPTNLRLIRWYDGQQWTETTQRHPDLK